MRNERRRVEIKDSVKEVGLQIRDKMGDWV